MKMLLRYSLLLLLILASSALSAQDFQVSQSIKKQNDIKGGWYIVSVDPNLSGLTPEGGKYADIHCVDTTTNLRYFYNYVSQGWDTLAAVETATGNGLFDVSNEGDTIAVSTYNQNQDLVQQTNGNQWEVDYTDGARKREIFLRDDQMGFLMDQGDGDLFRFQSTYVLGQHSTVFETIDNGSQAELTLSGANAALRADDGTDQVSFEVDANSTTGFRMRTKGGAANDLVIAAQDGSGNIEYENVTDLMSLSVTSPTDSTRQFNLSSAGQTISSNIFSVKGGDGGGGVSFTGVSTDATLTGDGLNTDLSVNEAGLSIGFGQITGFPSDLADGDDFLASRALVIAGAGGQAQFDLLDQNANNMATLNFVGGNGVEFSDNLGRLQIDFEDTFLDNRSLFQSGSTSEFRLLDNNGNIMTGITFLEGNGVTLSNNLGRLEISATEYWSRNTSDGVLSPATATDKIALNSPLFFGQRSLISAKSSNAFTSSSEEILLDLQAGDNFDNSNIGGRIGIGLGSNALSQPVLLEAVHEGQVGGQNQVGFAIKTILGNSLATQSETFRLDGNGKARFHSYANGDYEFSSLGSGQRISIWDTDGSLGKLPLSGILSTDANNGASLGSDGLLYVTADGSGDGNDFVSSASFNSSTGVLTLGGSGGAGATVDLDGRYDESTSNELQTISKVGSTVTLSNGGGSFVDETESLWVEASNNISYSAGEVSIGGTDTNSAQLELLGGFSVPLYVDGEHSNFTLDSDEFTNATTLNSYSNVDAMQSSINMSNDEVSFSDSNGSEFLSATPTNTIIEGVPEYANEAAANADTNLFSGSLYQVIGSDALYRKK